MPTAPPKGKTTTAKPSELTAHALTSNLVLNNSHLAWITDYDNGKMDGFGSGRFVNGHRWTLSRISTSSPSHIQPYWTMAKQYVLADHMFQTQSSGSFIAHQDLIRGEPAINRTRVWSIFRPTDPWGCDAPTSTKTSLITKRDST